MKSIPYALCLLIGGLVGWKLSRLTRKATKPVRERLSSFYEDRLDEIAASAMLDAPVPYRFTSYTPDQFYDGEPTPGEMLDGEPCYGEAVSLPRSPVS